MSVNADLPGLRTDLRPEGLKPLSEEGRKRWDMIFGPKEQAAFDEGFDRKEPEECSTDDTSEPEQAPPPPSTTT